MKWILLTDNLAQIKGSESQAEPTHWDKAYGQVIENTNIAVIDLDNMKAVEVFDKWLSKYGVVTRKDTTIHGAHYFFKCERKSEVSQGPVKLPCGVLADWRTKAYITVKKDGVRYLSDNADTIAPIPKWAFPICKCRGGVKASDNWLEGVGISRNDSLRDLMYTLGGKFKDEELKEMIYTVNELTLNEPLPIDELDSTLLRRESVDKCSNLSDNYKYNDTRAYASDYVHENTPFEIIVNGGNNERERLGLYAFDGWVYSQVDVDRLAYWIYDRHSDWDTLKGESALKYVQRDYKHQKVGRNKLNFNKFTPFHNGVLNTETGEFIPDGNIPEHMNTIGINHKYIEDYQYDEVSDLIDDFMTVLACDDQEIVDFLWLWLGLCLAKSTVIDKILFMYGSGENLKSYFMSMVENAFPCINRPIKRLGTDFGCQNIDNGYVLYSTEMYEGNMSDNCGDITRQISSQDTISINGKHTAEYQNRPICKMLYATNCEVKLGVGKNAKRRTIYVPFNWNSNTCRSVDSELLNKLGLTIQSMKNFLASDERVAEYVLHKAVEGLRRYINGDNELRWDKPNCCLPKSAIELTHAFNTNEDTVTQWIESQEITADKLSDRENPITKTQWYDAYCQWVEDSYLDESKSNKFEVEGMKVKAKTFRTQVTSIFNLSPADKTTSINGRVYRMFTKM